MVPSLSVRRFGSVLIFSLDWWNTHLDLKKELGRRLRDFMQEEVSTAGLRECRPFFFCRAQRLYWLLGARPVYFKTRQLKPDNSKIGCQHHLTSILK